MTYGTTRASYLAIKSLRKLAEEYMSEYPLGAKATLNNFYVGDVLCGAQTVEEAIKTELLKILRLGGFDLKKWASNTEVLRNEDT